jgi:hypothetical protein
MPRLPWLFAVFLVGCTGGPAKDGPAGSTDVEETEATEDSAPWDPQGPWLAPLDLDAGALRVRLREGIGDPQADEAYGVLLAEVEGDCAATIPAVSTDPLDLGALRTLAEGARACAFLGWLDNDPLLQAKAAGALTALPGDWEGLEDPTVDVHVHTAVAHAVQAWDLLAAAGFDDPAAEEAVRNAVRRSWQRWAVDDPLWMMAWRNNHNWKFDAGLGMAAIRFPDEPDAPLWLAQAQADGRYVLSQNTVPDGGHGEGTYYLTYGDQQWIPYLRAYDRRFGTKERTYKETCATRPPADCDGEPEVIGSLLRDSRHQKTWAWARDLVRPDGLRPAIDDSRPDGHPGALLASLDPTFAGEWLQAEKPFIGMAGDTAVDTLLGWDGAHEPVSTGACVHQPAAGTSVVATGRDPQATWALLLGEPAGNMQGGGHEHDDLGAIELFAKGTSLLPMPGYASWSQREATASAAAHSAVLVEDQSWKGATLSWTGEACAPVLTLDDGDHRWTRSLRLEAGEVVVEDHLEVPEGTAWTARFHTLSRGDRGTFTATPWGGWLDRPEASLALVVGADVPLSLSVDTGSDALGYGSIQDHDVLVVEGQGPARLRAVLAPQAPGGRPLVSVDGLAVTVGGTLFD